LDDEVPQALVGDDYEALVGRVFDELKEFRQHVAVDDGDLAKYPELVRLARLIKRTEKPNDYRIRETLRAAIKSIADDSCQQVLLLSFGLVPGAGVLSAPQRRERAWDEFAGVSKSISLQTFRKGPELKLFQILARSLVELKDVAAVDGLELDAPAAVTVADSLRGLRLLGIRDVFVPLQGNRKDENGRRNQAKIRAIKDASDGETIRIVARTGHSFFAPMARLYVEHIESFLERGGNLQVVISSDIAVEKCMAWTEFKHYKVKSEQSVAGLQALKKRWGEKVRIGVFDSMLPATMLLTPSVAFYEPYLLSDGMEREQLLFTSFEFEFEVDDPSGHLARLLSGSFEYLWNRSKQLTLMV
jgi:hypothetical protein